LENAIVNLSARQLRMMIGRKAISPVEVVNAYIEQIENFNAGINAICATDFERALNAAKVAEQAVMNSESLGRLHGLPLGVKDLTETAGLLTTFGNIDKRAHVPDRDNSMVARLRQAGAIVLAKTNTPDMGAGANTRNAVWGATGNPFNPKLNAGGSSGGSAAALATNMVPLATGTDVGGSLRIPAALCGIVGMRPSPGMIGQDSRKLGWHVLNIIGPMARNVEDLALLFASSMGEDRLDPLAYPANPQVVWPIKDIDLATLRVGYTEDFGCCSVDPMIRRAFRLRIQAISRHVSICEPIELNLGNVHRAFDVLRAEGFLAQMGQSYEKDPDSLSSNVRANMEIARQLTLSDRAWAHLEQTSIMQSFARKLRDYDVILSPTTPVSPFPWEKLYADEIDGQKMDNYYQWLALTYVVTLSTHPALSLPMGLDECQMPFGIQMIGPLHQDGRLIAIAKAFESAFEDDLILKRPIPDTSKLRKDTAGLRTIVTHPPIFPEGAATA